LEPVGIKLGISACSPQAYAQVGQIQPGLRVIAEAKDLLARNEEHTWEGELNRIEGELLQARGSSSPEVEACFVRAIATARQQGAKSLELRAATSLARLRAEQGKRAEAHDLLAPVYGWFTEGFDTADLQGAKELLEELT
jgi:predicted ATPase